MIKSKTLRVDGYIAHIQQSIRNIMSPVAQMWMSVAEERENLFVATVDTSSEEAKAELERRQTISLILQVTFNQSNFRADR